MAVCVPVSPQLPEVEVVAVAARRQVRSALRGAGATDAVCVAPYLRLRLGTVWLCALGRCRCCGCCNWPCAPVFVLARWLQDLPVLEPVLEVHSARGCSRPLRSLYSAGLCRVVGVLWGPVTLPLRWLWVHNAPLLRPPVFDIGHSKFARQLCCLWLPCSPFQLLLCAVCCTRS
jgi:hypothetical protein